MVILIGRSGKPTCHTYFCTVIFSLHVTVININDKRNVDSHHDACRKTWKVILSDGCIPLFFWFTYISVVVWINQLRCQRGTRWRSKLSNMSKDGYLNVRVWVSYNKSSHKLWWGNVRWLQVVGDSSHHPLVEKLIKRFRNIDDGFYLRHLASSIAETVIEISTMGLSFQTMTFVMVCISEEIGKQTCTLELLIISMRGFVFQDDVKFSLGCRQFGRMSRRNM